MKAKVLLAFSTVAVAMGIGAGVALSQEGPVVETKAATTIVPETSKVYFNVSALGQLTTMARIRLRSLFRPVDLVGPINIGQP